jgi:hypothetical protein
VKHLKKFLKRIGFRPSGSKTLSAWYCNSRELHCLRDTGRSLCIRWCDIDQVTWSEPDFKLFDDKPFWWIRVGHVRLRVAHRKELLMAFAKYLPSFDEKVIDLARKIGHFSNPNSMACLDCWKRANSVTQTAYSGSEQKVLLT